MATGENSSARWDGARRMVAAALAATFIVVVPLAVASAWIRGTVLSTSGYVAAISNIAASPAVRTVIRESVTAEASALLAGVSRHSALVKPLRTAIANFVGKETSAFMAGAAFRRLWVAANQFAHAQLISVLNGSSALVSATGKQVTVNLIPLVSDILHGHVSALPSIQIPLFPAAALARLRHAYRILTATTWLAFTLTPMASASALAVSPRRRRTLLHMTTGGTLTLLLGLTVLSWLQSSLTARSDPRYQPVTGAILHALTSSFFTITTWCVAGSLTLTIVTLLSGRIRRR